MMTQQNTDFWQAPISELSKNLHFFQPGKDKSYCGTQAKTNSDPILNPNPNECCPICRRKYDAIQNYQPKPQNIVVIKHKQVQDSEITYSQKRKLAIIANPKYKFNTDTGTIYYKRTKRSPWQQIPSELIDGKPYSHFLHDKKYFLLPHDQLIYISHYGIYDEILTLTPKDKDSANTKLSNLILSCPAWYQKHLITEKQA